MKDLKDGKTKEGIRTFEIVQYVTGPLPGSISDWPSNIQDQIMAALEKKSKEVQLPLMIVGSYCDIDHGDTEAQDKYFLRIIASEIVVKDAGFAGRVNDAERMIKEALDKGSIH